MHLIQHALHQRVLPGIGLHQQLWGAGQQHPRLAVPLQQGSQVAAVQLKPAAEAAENTSSGD